jgi:hypothetical protein
MNRAPESTIDNQRFAAVTPRSVLRARIRGSSTRPGLAADLHSSAIALQTCRLSATTSYSKQRRLQCNRPPHPGR